MKWITHETSVLLLGTALNANTFLLSSMLVGAILPDLIDSKISFGNKKLFWKVHRGFSHCFLLYILILGLSYLFQTELYKIDKELLLIISGLCLGSLTHILFDALNPMGVPILPFMKKPRIAINLLKTGSLQEYCLLGIMIICVALVNFEWLNYIIQY